MVPKAVGSPGTASCGAGAFLGNKEEDVGHSFSILKINIII